VTPDDADPPAAVVLDTNVLSSFHTAGWFDGLGTWPPDTEVLATEAVWLEFQEYASIEQPDWLGVEAVDLDRIETRTPGALAPADWSCLALVDAREGARLVTNDRGIHTVAQRRDVPFEWGTRFLLRTFQRCGLTRATLDAGQDVYIDDLGLPEEVAAEIRTATKD
jgi:rRNA-processing protein FCF1